MRIVFDASTLILLAKCELLELFLCATGAENLIPPEVENESCEAKRSLDALLIRGLIELGKIKVVPLKDPVVSERLQRDLTLGRGEADAIALALEARADLVATDDWSAIRACKLAKIPFTSAPAILVRMREKGVLERDAALGRLLVLEREGRYKKRILAAVRRQLEES
jgi:predicted nucleic acid-binding protein